MPHEHHNDRDALVHNDELDSDAQLVNPINVDTPRDKFYLCHISFFIIGLTQLLPWNFLVTATNYWMYKFRDLNGTIDRQFANSIVYQDEKAGLQTVFDSYLAIASNSPFLLVFALSFSKYLKRISETAKNCVSFTLLVLVFTAITSFVLVDTDKFQMIFLACTLVLVFLLNSVAAFIQANFAGLASLMPNSIMHMMVTGQAMSGLFAVAAQIFSLLGNWSILQSTFVYFLFADLIILSTLAIYYFTTKTYFFNFYNPQNISTDPSFDNPSFDLGVFKLVFTKMWPYCITLMLNFWTSLSVYPAVVVLVNPQADHPSFWTSKFFLPICCFLMFNLCDFLGRYLGQFGLLPRKKAFVLLMIAVCRIAFIPLFIFCNMHPRHLPVAFGSQYYYLAFMILFGLSNGYLVLNVFVNGPLSVPIAYRKLSGFFLMLFLGLGLTLGSFTSTALVRIL